MSRKCQPNCQCKRHIHLVSDESKKRMSAAAKARGPNRLGIACSEETKRKIGAANAGRVMSAEEKARRSAAMQKAILFKSQDFSKRSEKVWAAKTSEERKRWGQAISISKKLAHKQRGNLGDGDVVPTAFSYILRRQIKDRDNYHCAICWASGITLVVHHIDHNRANNDWSNLITLCRACHNRGHNLGYWPIDLKSKAVKFNYQNAA